jgi:hypothetical protein
MQSQSETKPKQSGRTQRPNESKNKAKTKRGLTQGPDVHGFGVLQL